MLLFLSRRLFLFYCTWNHIPWWKLLRNRLKVIFVRTLRNAAILRNASSKISLTFDSTWPDQIRLKISSVYVANWQSATAREICAKLNMCDESDRMASAYDTKSRKSPIYRRVMNVHPLYLMRSDLIKNSGNVLTERFLINTCFCRWHLTQELSS